MSIRQSELGKEAQLEWRGLSPGGRLLFPVLQKIGQRLPGGPVRQTKSLLQRSKPKGPLQRGADLPEKRALYRGVCLGDTAWGVAQGPAPGLRQRELGQAVQSSLFHGIDIGCSSSLLSPPLRPSQDMRRVSAVGRPTSAG